MCNFCLKDFEFTSDTLVKESRWHLCGCDELGTERDYFVHMICDYKPNVNGTFTSRKSRKHNLHSLADFKEEFL